MVLRSDKQTVVSIEMLEKTSDTFLNQKFKVFSIEVLTVHSLVHACDGKFVEYFGRNSLHQFDDNFLMRLFMK